jgi:hypothetical protein
MFLQTEMVMFTAKPIMAGSRKQVLDGLTKDLLLPENLHQGHQHQDHPLLAEVGQIWIVRAHHASEAQQGRITIRTPVTPAAETEVLVVVEGQEVVAGVLAVEAEVAAGEDDKTISLNKKTEREKMKTRIRSKHNYKIASVLAIYICAATIIVGGCETRTQTGTLAGTGIGALIGQAVGGDTKATLIGAAIGAGAGHLIGNSQDKKAAKEYDMMQPTTLTGTKWKIVNLLMQDKPKFDSMTVDFRPDGKIVTTRYEPGGTMTFTEERYRIVGDTLIINKSDYIINANYRIEGNKMTVDCDQFRAILERV